MPLDLAQYMRAATRLLHELGRAPLVEELADELDVPVPEVLQFISRYDQRAQAVEPSHLLETGDQRWFTRMRAQVDQALRSLTPLEQRIVRLRFGLDDGHQRTLDEVAAVLGMDREQARQVEARALGKLRRTPPR